jgi:hypothetical protein
MRECDRCEPPDSICLVDHFGKMIFPDNVASRTWIEQDSRYASGATIQILLFATLAIELKRRAPNAHTFLEVVEARYGRTTHFIYITFGLMTNILVTAMLLTGGSAVASSLTGVPTAAACFLLPVGVVLYTMFGGGSISTFARASWSLTPAPQVSKRHS